ncbi:MAG: hypothetical protein AVDCRST_MAG33-265 [uncultured Thermomicrobiales bacterium]|uniref:Uncharacterized protein n=1 Tax=uncultured Thermomicrobiales bacterium TaxID=1645740 RepID=A0A6J4UA42_9BACT|nr:MAG: hypothetical protein AVDCRST_MAG33-265 [uncultured Thermomicrobiales bacterium]
MVAFLIKLTGIPAEIAFNLAQPTVMAFLAAGAFGVAASLGRDIARRFNVGRVATVAAGLMGAVLMVAVGNLGGLFNLLRFPDDRSWNVVWDPSRAVPSAITEFPYFTGLYADLHAHGIALPITVLVVGLCYSLASQPRLVNLALSRGRVGRWRALLGVRVVALGVILGTLYMTNAWDIATYVLFAAASVLLATRAMPTLVARLIATGALLAVIGAVGFASVLPFYLKFVTLFSEIGRVREPTAFWQVMTHFGGLIAIVIVGVTALLASGARGGWRVWLQPLLPIIGIAVLLGLAALANGRVTGDGPGLRIDDVLILGLIAVLALLLAAASWSRGNTLRGPTPVASLRRLVIGVSAVSAVGAAVVGQPVFGIGAAVVGVGAFLYLFIPGTAPRMVGLLIGAGGGVVAALEVVYLVDNLDGGTAYRMNTVFKFYNQSWVLLALAGAALFGWMVARVISIDRVASSGAASADGSLPRDISYGTSQPSRYASGIVARPIPVMAATSVTGSPSVGWSRIGLLVVAMVVAASAVYPITATPIRLDNRYPETPNTLNAYVWMDHATISSEGPTCTDPLRSDGNLRFQDDRAAIDWFNREVDGAPVIAELNLDNPYFCFASRFSVSTGLPTIIGWQNHESQQRYPDDLGPRQRDVATLYASSDPDEKLAILREYDVEYVVVGALERDLTDGPGRPVVDPAGLATFDAMVGTSLEVAFQQGGTTVYRVLPATTDAP